jgi:protein gp37
MAEKTKIQWTDHTFNPWRGCTKVADGCTNCYAETLSHRNQKVLGAWGPKGTRVLAAEAQWREPAKWQRDAASGYPATNPSGGGRHDKVFCASLADVFEDWPGQMTDAGRHQLFVNDNTIQAITHPMQHLGNTGKPYTLADARTRLWQLIRQTPNLDWQLLTKRPDNIARMMPPGDWPNVWLGYSAASDKDLPLVDALLDAPQKVPVRFLSYEPAIGPLNCRQVLGHDSINWVIIGGESGPHARAFHVEWARQVLADCRDAGVPCFVKQLGRHPSDNYPDDEPPDQPPNRQLPTRYPLTTITDPKGGDWTEWPEDIRVREFPA